MFDNNTIHIILTRFNVKSAGKESKIRLQPDWLASRFRLFETYCYPSVSAQSNKNFKWLIYFDVDTPMEFKEKIAQFEKDLPQMNAYYIDEWTTAAVHEAITGLLPSNAEKLLTTRLDNDDGIHSDFVKVLHEFECSETDWYFNFPNGLTFSDGYAYKHEDKSNAFLSRVESVQGFKTAWELPHPEVLNSGRLSQLTSLSNAWLQVVHGGNVSNKVRGRVVEPEQWIDGFHTLNDLAVKKVSIWVVLRDSVFGYWFRLGRDAVIKSLKFLLRR